jgi:pimeloyl-ACP methyl ester carboxylesterase
MNVNVQPPWPARGRAIALHCSGAGASRWRCLAEALGAEYDLSAPEHYGCESRGPWTGEHAFTLADEATSALALIDAAGDEVHLIGHSYGGGVALHVALVRPDRIASLTLYEPSAFHLLTQMGERGLEGYVEIAGVAQRVGQATMVGDHRGGMSTFVDYWNGPGAWSAMRPAAQDALVKWAPTASLEFHALLDNRTPAGDYRALRFPVLILRGEHAPRPTRLVAEGLSRALPSARLSVVAGAGHLGPLTHAVEVAQLMARHIVAASPTRERAAMTTILPRDA